MKINAALAHKRLWNWLAKHPTKTKWQWPEWDTNRGKIPRYNINSSCFACEARIQFYPKGNCRQCQLSQELQFLLCGTDGLYNNWKHNQAAIAALPWKGPKMITIPDE